MNEFIKTLLQENAKFVQSEKYKDFSTTKYPDKKTVILSCMDTRLTELLPAALNFKNGDVKIIKNAGGVVNHPFGSIARSLLVAIYELGVEKVLVVGHYDCGMQGLDSQKMLHLMGERGIHKDTLNVIRQCGIDLDRWLSGFDEVEESVKSTVDFIRNHPLVPEYIQVYGLIIDPETGRLDYIEI